MGRHSLMLLLVLGALLLTPGAAGGPSVPGDPTPPVVTPVVSGTLGSNGWYLSNVTVNWLVVDPESVILETQGCDARTLTADTADTRLTCYARSDGGEATVSITIRIDRTPPTVTATPARAPDSNGWYNHSLTVSFTGTDATSGVESCVPPQSYSGPDGPNRSVSGSCRDVAGNTAVRVFALSYDATAPQVTGATPSRPPDSNGWYNHSLSVGFTGSDATSGVDTCTQASYAGPDNAAASVSGTCRDRAGNQSGTSAFALMYDATAPQVTGASPSRPPDSNGWYNHSLSVGFTGSDATSGIDTCTQASYAGPDNAAASVSGTCRDRAGNQSGTSAFALSYDATGPLVAAHPRSRPRLERLVQPLAERQLHGHGRHLRARILRPAPDLLRSGRLQPLGERLLSRRGRQHHRARVRPHVRRDRAAGHRDPRSRPRLERLVQPLAERQLHGHGRHLRRRVLRPGADLLRSGRSQPLGQRLLPRRGRQHDRACASRSCTTRRRRR